jgi:hypothetical protein
LNDTVIVFETPPEVAVTVTPEEGLWAEVRPTQPIKPAEEIMSNANIA